MFPKDRENSWFFNASESSVSVGSDLKEVSKLIYHNSIIYSEKRVKVQRGPAAKQKIRVT